jgi:hypothetical protein
VVQTSQAGGQQYLLHKIPKLKAAVSDAIAQGRTTAPVHCVIKTRPEIGGSGWFRNVMDEVLRQQYQKQSEQQQINKTTI